ncbi:transcriptional regulator [Providencia huaxiensis]|uniref:Transcriptional regulator n=1 Tax=Providencia rettgeri TaxID=587 RepID=A0A3R8W1L2_PRORE|nr:MULTISPECIES: transcriptional regulator [Providencia]ELR5073564.1 transcriptional regulator [Providencia stuartii]ELR5071365.1 transcriptional regulator [Providencia rettgeri]ELR5072336.1 transcriptional regulator [Providencia rettgeri]ELR5076216.1 transcriptional regulator [Providencia stuartii]ELR5217248.1 transcriptional regulator [Providencia rettgeri]
MPIQRETILSHALNQLEIQGLSASTENLLSEIESDFSAIRQFWPDDEALVYDCLRFHSQQIEVWQRQTLLDESLSPHQKLMARYQQLSEKVSQGRFPGCLFISACNYYPDAEHPIHQLSRLQKDNSFHFTKNLLDELDIEDSTLVANQMELVLEGCLNRLLVQRDIRDVEIAQHLSEDILTIALCRKKGALS